MSGVRCNMSHILCHKSLKLTATAADQPLANSPSMHSRMLLLFLTSIPKHFCFAASFTISEPKLQFMRAMSFHYISLKNIFIINEFDVWTNNVIHMFFKIEKNYYIPDNICFMMEAIKKNWLGQTNRQTNTRASWLIDWIGFEANLVKIC